MGSSCNVTRNLEQNGIEIRFSNRPDESIINKLKSNGFRWSGRGHWYTKYVEYKHKFALDMCGNGTNEAELTTESLSNPIEPNARIRKITLAVCDDQLRFGANVLRMEVEQGKLEVCTARTWNYQSGDYGGDWNGIREDDKVWRDAMLSDVPSRVNTTVEKRWTDKDDDSLTLRRHNGRILFKALEFRYKKDVENWDYDVEAAQKDIKEKKDAAYRSRFMYDTPSYYVPVNKKAVSGGFKLTNTLSDAEKLQLKDGDPILMERGGFSFVGVVSEFRTYNMVSTSYDILGSGMSPKTQTSEARCQFNITLDNGFKDSVYGCSFVPQGFEADDMPLIKMPELWLKSSSRFNKFEFPFNFWDKIISIVGGIEDQRGNAQRAKKSDKIQAYNNAAAEYEKQLVEMKALFLAWETDNMAASRRFTGESEEEQTYRRFAWQPTQTEESQRGMANMKSQIDAGVRTMTNVERREQKATPSVYTPITERGLSGEQMLEEYYKESVSGMVMDSFKRGDVREIDLTGKEATPSVPAPKVAEKVEEVAATQTAPKENFPFIKEGDVYLWKTDMTSGVLLRVDTFDYLFDMTVTYTALESGRQHTIPLLKFHQFIEKGEIIKQATPSVSAPKNVFTLPTSADFAKYMAKSESDLEGEFATLILPNVANMGKILAETATALGVEISTFNDILKNNAHPERKAALATYVWKMVEMATPTLKTIPEYGQRIKFVKDYSFNNYFNRKIIVKVGQDCEFRGLSKAFSGIGFDVAVSGSIETISPSFLGYDQAFVNAEYDRIEAEKQAAKEAEAARKEAEEQAIREDVSRATPNLTAAFFDAVTTEQKKSVFDLWGDNKAARQQSDATVKAAFEKQLAAFNPQHEYRYSSATKLTFNDLAMYGTNADFAEMVNAAVFADLAEEHADFASMFATPSVSDDELSILEPVTIENLNLPTWLSAEDNTWIEDLLTDGFELTNKTDYDLMLEKKGVNIEHKPYSHSARTEKLTIVLKVVISKNAMSKYQILKTGKDYDKTDRHSTIEAADAALSQLFNRESDGEFSDIEATATQKITAKRAYELNLDIERILKERGDNPDNYSADMKQYISQFTGYGGLDKFGATGKGILYEYYTPAEAIERMWALALHHGYDGGNVLEPAAGVGDFLKIAPKTTKAAHYTALELNPVSAQIMKILFPLADVKVQYFEQLFLQNNDTVGKNVNPLYDLVIGNPPYGTIRGKQSNRYMEMGERKYTKATAYDEYFISRGLDLLRPGGLLLFIIGSEVANGGVPFLLRGWTPAKRLIAEKSHLLDAYRLPNGIFDRTDVLSDIIVLQKK